MNAAIARLTIRSVLGRRRALMLGALPVVLLAICALVRLLNVASEPIAINVLQPFGLGTVLPLLALIAGTGVIGPEIDDGEIIYLITKPVRRMQIVITKYVVAVGLIIVFAVVPTLIAGWILAGTDDRIALGFAVGALAGSIAYAALFVALAVVSRHAVVIGLIYALIWETLIGGFVPGARTLSVQQWAFSVADLVSPAYGIHAAVRIGVALPFIAVVTALGLWFAGRRLSRLSLANDD